MVFEVQAKHFQGPITWHSSSPEAITGFRSTKTWIYHTSVLLLVTCQIPDSISDGLIHR